MTWIIGATTVFGYGALISDTEVTFQNKTNADLIQKAYPISNYIGAGFAGSVKIGFSLIDRLTKLASSIPQAMGESIDPIFLARSFSPIARSVFSEGSDAERRLNSHLLIVGASPTENSGLGARVYLTRMVSPYFVPEIKGANIKVLSIGSGAESKELKHRIKRLVRHDSKTLQAEIGRPGGWAEIFSFSVTRALHDNPIPGVSPHHHLILVDRGLITLSNNDEKIYDGDDTVTEFKMPDVAKSYSEFVQLCQSKGYASAEAQC